MWKNLGELPTQTMTFDDQFTTLIPTIIPHTLLRLCSSLVRVLFESCSQNGGFSEGFSNKTRRTLEEHTTEERWSLSLSLIVK